MNRFHALLTGLLLLASGTWTARAATITIDFDSLAPGNYPGTFLAGSGISNITAGGTGPGAGGPRIRNPAPYVPGSPPNVFVQDYSSLDQGQTHTLSFFFSIELTAFQLTRFGTEIEENSIPQWSASFYNSGGNLLGSFGEPYTADLLLPTPFGYTAPGGQTIARMDLTSVWTVSTFRNILVDDFVLTQLPEPSCAFLSLAGIAAIGLRRRRNQAAPSSVPPRALALALQLSSSA